MKTITDYVIESVYSENKDTFLKRVSAIVSKLNLTERFCKGIPTKVNVINNNKLIKFINAQNSKDYNIQPETVEITDSFDIIIRYTFIKQVWYKNEKDIENGEKGYWVSTNDTQDEEYTVKGNRLLKDMIYINEKDAEKAGLQVLYV